MKRAPKFSKVKRRAELMEITGAAWMTMYEEYWFGLVFWV